MTYESDLAQVRSLRARRAVDRLDELRATRRMVEAKGQSAVAKALRLSQPAISKAMAAAEQVREVVDGFSGASPYEIAQRYAAGLIDRERMLDELCRWEYPPRDRTDGYDSLLIDVPGSFDEVGRALSASLIDADEYTIVLDLAPHRHHHTLSP